MPKRVSYIKNKILLLFSLTATNREFINFSEIIGCYFASWAEYRKSEGKFTIDNIDSSLCTHIFYAFAGLGSDASVRVLDPVLDIKNNGFKRFNNLRKKNPELKTLISMGGWNEGSENYTK